MLPQNSKETVQMCGPVSWPPIPTNAIAVLLILLLLVSVTWINPARALDMPTGEVLLKLGGDIHVTNNGDEAWFDLAMLKALGSTEVKTKTPWTKGLAVFKGVRLKQLLDSVGADSKPFEALAVNKYRINFTGIDYDKYPIIVAWELNGEPLTIRTLGPLWIMFPYTDYPEIDTEANRNAAVWQLLRMTVY